MKTIICKLGNMRKAVEWTVYPTSAEHPTQRIIQSDKRIAKVLLDTGIAILSSGKRGNGFVALSPLLGAVEVPVPPETIAELKAMDIPTGPIRVL